MLFMTTIPYDYLFWFEEDGFKSETNGFCSNHILILRRLNVVHDDNTYNIQCWQEEVWFESETNGFCSDHFLVVEHLDVVDDNQSIGSSVLIWMGSASNLKPTVSATTFSLLWNVLVLSMTAKTKDHLCWFEKDCFDCETNGFCSNSFLMVKHLNVVHDRQSLGWSVLI